MKTKNILGAAMLLFAFALIPQQASAQMIPPEWPLPPSEPGTPPPTPEEPVIDPVTGEPLTPEEAAYANLTREQQLKLYHFYTYHNWDVPPGLMYCIMVGISRRDGEIIRYE